MSSFLAESSARSRRRGLHLSVLERNRPEGWQCRGCLFPRRVPCPRCRKRVVRRDLVGNGEHRDLQVNLRNPQHRQWISRLLSCGLSVGPQSLLAPETEVNDGNLQRLGRIGSLVRHKTLCMTLAATISRRFCCGKLLDRSCDATPTFNARYARFIPVDGPL